MRESTLTLLVGDRKGFWTVKHLQPAIQPKVLQVVSGDMA